MNSFRLLPCCLAILLAASYRAEAQTLEVTNAPPITPQNLITNIFLGDGVEVLNVTYQGSANAVGFFKNGQNATGMERGLVMTTGRAVTQGVALGVAEPGSAQASVDNGSQATDPDMVAIAGTNQIFNISKYIITFIPIADTLRFRYAFASEEYPEFVCSEFNDIFGFFISGPGINGPYQNNAINIARIPGTNLPVTINNVNPGVVGGAGTIEYCTPPRGSLAFSQFYNSNDGSNSFPVYDGITDVFTAEAIVQPCQVYTIKLVICDVGDHAYDSGVFLEAKSFGTGSLQVDVATVSLDGSVAEGCSPGRVTFSLPQPTTLDYYVDYRVLGSAINGVDYVRLPDSLFIRAGRSTAHLDIIALEDGLAEGLETLVLDVQRDACNRDTITILLRDNPLIKPDLGPDTTLCVGAPLALNGIIPIPLPPPPSFSNANNLTIQPTNAPVYSNITVSGVVPNVLGPQVLRSVCIDSLSHPWIDDLDIFLITPGGQFLELSTDNGGNGGNGLAMDFMIRACFTPTANRRINFPGPFAPPSAVPFTGNWLPEGEWSDIWGGPVNGTWRLLLIDDTNGAVGTLHSWTITFNAVYDIQYQWSPAAGLSCTTCPTPVATPAQPVEYIIQAVDSYGCTTADSIQVQAVPLLDAPQAVCGTVTDTSVTIAWTDVAGATGYEINVNGGGWQMPSQTLGHRVGNLNTGQEVQFLIRAIGQCPGGIDTLQCRTLVCSPPLLSAQVTDASCAGLNDGAVQLSAPAGAGTPVFSLQGQSNSTGVFTNLAPGLYVATYQDTANCPATVEFTIQAPQILTLTPVLIDTVRCHGERNGSARIETSGGQGPYTYVWSNGETTPTAVALEAGPHSVRITDAAGCQAEATIDIPQPAPLTATTQATAVRCPGAGDGSLAAMPLGGVMPYTYRWDTAAGSQLMGMATGLAGGAYEVTVTDARGCTAYASGIVPEPAPVQWQVQSSDVVCFGEATGTATAAVSGGNGGWALSWSNGWQGAAQNNLLAGIYGITATDSQGCRDSLSVVISQPAAPLTVQWQVVQPACFGQSSGSVRAIVSGGTPGYQIQWQGLPPQTDPLRAQLAAGTYPVTITDANHCALSDVVTLTEPPLLTASLALTSARCHGISDGAATVLPVGGTPPYSFAWSSGQTTEQISGLGAGVVSVQITDANGCQVSTAGTITQPTPLLATQQVAPARCFGAADGAVSLTVSGGVEPYAYVWSNGQQTASATGLAAGTYTYTVTDSNACQATGSATVQQPPALTGSITGQNPTCHPLPDGRAQIVAGGGTPPYTYRWDDGQQQTADTAVGLSAGWYRVQIRDANGCMRSDSVQLIAPPLPQLQLQARDVRCHGGNDGSITATLSAGTNPFQYQWSMPSIGNTLTPTGLPAGTYSLTVTDALACTAVQQAEIAQPLPLILSAVPQHIACVGNATGSIDLTVTGGVQPYRYTWSHGDTREDPDRLGPGQYTVTLSDANDCTATLSSTILQTNPIEAAISMVPAACFGTATGGASAQITGGTPPYQYLWSNGATTAAIQQVPAGDYTLRVTDSVGCQSEFSVRIAQPEMPLAANPSIWPPTCAGETNGRIELAPSGGTAPYVYSLNGGAFAGNRTFVALGAGVYQVTVRDAAGCVTQTGPLTLEAPLPLSVSLGIDRIVAYGDTVQLGAMTTNGVPPLVYDWRPRDTTLLSCLNCPAPVARPSYQVAVRVTVTDANGCSAEDLVNLFVTKDPRAYVPTGFTPNDDGQNDRLLVHGRTGIRVLVFRVFDRWGQLLYEGGGFEINDTTQGWDGTFRNKPAASDTYLWTLTIELPDGARETLSGQTSLIR